MDFTTITVGPQTWRYHDAGSGPVVVLLHGFPDTPQSWAATVELLTAAGHRVVVPYLRGYHPDTIVADRPYDGAAVGEDVIGLLDALDIQRAVVGGHDWGASAVYRLAADHPDRLRGVVPIAVPHPASSKPSLGFLWEVRHFIGFKTPWADVMTRRSDFAYIETLYRRWAPSWTGPDRDATVERVKEHFRLPGVLHAAIDYYRDLSFSNPSGNFRVPVPGLLVAGSADFLPEAHERSVRKFDAEAELVMIDGAGHWPHREGAGAFHDALMSFLERLPD